MGDSPEAGAHNSQLDHMSIMKVDVATVELVMEKRDSESSVCAHEKAAFASELHSVPDLPPPPLLTKMQEKTLYRKVDLHLIPILALMYLMSFLDRGMCLPICTGYITNPLYRREHR